MVGKEGLIVLGSERPWRRSIFRILMYVLWGRSGAHTQDWLPGLSLTIPQQPFETGTIVYRGHSISPLLHPAVLKNSASQEIFIIGSGPSLRSNDLSLIGPRTAILLNGAISLLTEGIDAPLAIAIEDERFVWRHFQLMAEKIGAGSTCLFSTAVIRAICEINDDWLADKTVILIDNIRKPYGGKRREYSQLADLDFVRVHADEAGFSSDPSKGVFQGGSVAISAFQFAAYCKPATIGFFGVDISNANGPRFYERIGSIAKSGIAHAKRRILAHVVLGIGVCIAQGTEVLNFSPISALSECGLPYDSRYAWASAQKDDLAVEHSE
jgi:hypothetical protein